MTSQTGQKKIVSKPKLLVVDDEPDNLDLLYRTFHREFKVLRAESGPEALQILAEQGEVAVIISDQRMPSMSGTEFLSLTATQYPDIIRIILTGYTDVDDLVEAINSGKVFKFVTKPWDDDHLKSVVRQAVDTHNVLKTRTQELRRTLRQESLVNTVTRAIRGALSSNQILQTIVETVGLIIGADCCVLRPMQHDVLASETYLYVDRSVKNHLDPDLLAQTVWQVDALRNFQINLQNGDRPSATDNVQNSTSSAGNQATNSPAAELSDPSEADLSPKVEESYQSLGIQSSLLVPLSYQGELMAVLALHHVQKSHAWNPDDIHLITLVADQVALALSQARNYERVKALAKREALINMITAVIRSSLDPEDIFAAITQQLGQALHVDGCALSLWTAQDTFVHCVGLYDATSASERDDISPQERPSEAPSNSVLADSEEDLPLDLPTSYLISESGTTGETWISPMVLQGEGSSLSRDESALHQGEFPSIHHDLHHLPRSIAPIEGNPVLQQLMQTQESVVIDDLRQHPEMNPMDVPLRSPASALLVVPLIADGQIIGSISLRQINQPRKWLPEEIELAQAVASQAAIAVQQSRLYQTTRQQAEKLIELDRQKTEFFQNISHEFRTPLTLNIGPLESAVTEGEGLDYEQSVIALRNSRRLLRLVNQLLDLQRIDAGRMQSTFCPCDLVNFVRQVVESFRSYCAKRNIDLITRFGECPPLYLDVEKFDKVVYNLLSNAMKFTQAGGRIYVSVWTESDRCLLQVQDTGIGIREDQIPHLFERFRQADGSANRTYEGSGLGLAMVREMVELHGGEVAVESVYGQGTTLTVSLLQGTQHLPPDQLSDVPAEIEYHQALIEFADIDLEEEAPETEGSAELDSLKTISPIVELPSNMAAVPMPDQISTENVSDAIARTIGGAPPNSSSVKSKPFHLLVVDDNPDLRRYVKSILEGGGYQVSVARHGLEGLQIARREQPDLILTDLMMPKMSGLEMIQAIRQERLLQGIPIVLLTAKADEETRIEGTERGADAYLSKPFNHRELLAEVHNLIALKESERRILQLNTYLTESILQRFLPPSLVSKAARGELSLDLRPEPKLVTILFSDIVGFTQLSNTLRSRRVAELLNDYLTEMTHAIFEHGGTVDKFMGDAILAIFGAPEEASPNEQVRQAIAAARQMHRTLEKLNENWRHQGIPEVQFRCGIHQGTAVVGMFGSIERSDYTAIGPSVNIAARIQEAADPGSILVSAAVADYLDDTVIQKYSPLKLKGVDETVLTFAIKPRHYDEDE